LNRIRLAAQNKMANFDSWKPNDSKSNFTKGMKVVHSDDKLTEDSATASGNEGNEDNDEVTSQK
jgi:hypothetical protein